MDVTARTSVRVSLPVELVDALGVEARRRHLSVADLIDMLCLEFLPGLFVEAAQALTDLLDLMIANDER
jgi:hypothetical protein